MKNPKFWQKNNILSIILKPISIIYYTIYKLRYVINIKPYKSKIPVICIGNITAGGNGKTPMTIEIANILKKNNKNFCFLSKGYGGKFNGIKKVINENTKTFGDEPVILSEFGDVFVSKNRVNGLKYINDLTNKNYDYVIVDDGLQNPTFFKNKSILIIDGEYGLGNGNILPSGPLREKFKDIVDKIDFVVLIGEDKYNLVELCKTNLINVIRANIIIKENNFSDNYIAFCGIGHPEKFKKTLDCNKINYTNFITFDDHHFYKEKDIKKLKSFGKNLITTKKDWVKLDKNLQEQVDYIDIKIDFDQNNFIKMLRLYGI